MAENIEERVNGFDSKIMASVHINFLFGAGVNGSAFPHMSGFSETRETLEQILGREMVNFEDDLDSLSSVSKKEKVSKVFIKEFRKFHDNIEFSDASISDLKEMFGQINRLILSAENRTITTKQVNIYTLNYDQIIENVLIGEGFLVNVVSSSNIESHDKFFELIGYNYNLKKYIPTYLVSKIHGDIDNPILPGISKYVASLEAKRFEILFRMKSQLSRSNSVLIVIGYSGRDNHINTILKDCISSGLTIYWFRYDIAEIIPLEILHNTIIFDQPKKDEKQNMSKLFATKIKAIWEK